MRKNVLAFSRVKSQGGSFSTTSEKQETKKPEPRGPEPKKPGRGSLAEKRQACPAKQGQSPFCFFYHSLSK